MPFFICTSSRIYVSHQGCRLCEVRWGIEENYCRTDKLTMRPHNSIVVVIEGNVEIILLTYEQTSYPAIRCRHPFGVGGKLDDSCVKGPLSEPRVDAVCSVKIPSRYLPRGKRSA